MVRAKQGWLEAAQHLPRQRWKTDGSKWGERFHLLLDAILALGLVAAILLAPHCFVPQTETQALTAGLVMAGCAWMLSKRLPNIASAILRFWR